MADEYRGRVDFIDCNVWEDEEKASRYNITATPTLVFVDGDGNEVDRLLGYQTEDIIRSRIEPLLKE